MDHVEWLKLTTHQSALREIARRSDLTYSTLNGQVKRNTLSAENVIAIARAYGQAPVRALMETGYLNPDEVSAIDPVAALREVPEDELADEVLRRMKLLGDHTVFTTPVDELVAQKDQ